MDCLDKKSIDSFLRVAGGLAKSSFHSSSEKNGAAPAGSNPVDTVKDMSVIERAVKEGENIRLILRSSGHEFPAKDNTTHDNNPAYVVCLAHHVPSDQFILFVFNASTMPCQLIRFDRDGNVVESYVIRNRMCWNAIDAAVLVAAVNKCHEGNAAYFDNASGASTDKRRGECVRLVNMKYDADGTDVKMRSSGGEEDEDSDEEDIDEDEFEVIRALILTELLRDGSSWANFHHPDPNFLLPLAESISKELYNWRYMCNHIPSRSEWPKLPSHSEWQAANAEGASASEREELDEISLGRNSQFGKSVEYCQNAIEKMKSLLCKIAERGTDSASIYELGKEGILSLTTLEFMNQRHADTWPDYHDVFEEIEQTCFEASTQIKENLMTWKSASESISLEESDDEESDDEENSEWEEDDGCVEVASKLVSAWIKEDKALLKALSNVVATIDQTLKSEQQSLQGAIDRVEFEMDSILSLKKDAERKTKLNASRIIKLWNSSCSDDDDDDDEPWLRGALIPLWTKYDLESHISFGWCEAEHDDSSVMKFVIDVAGLTAGLKEFVVRLATYTTDHSQTKFDLIWEKKIQPAVNSTVNSIKTLLELGDLRNASIVAACCLRVFCDGDMIGAVGHWYENNDAYESEYDAYVVVAKKFQELWREYHPYVAAIALAYFDIESPKREAGSHWFFDILQSGIVYAPSDSLDFCWSTENRRTTPYKVRWGRLSHPACEIFHSHGWQHPGFHCLRGCNNEEELSLSDLRKYEAPTVIKERFNMTKKLRRTRDTIAFARILGGDHECIQYLFNNGLVDEAMEQASASKNVEGLSQLSEGLLSTNPRASVLCMQAYILEVMEGIDGRRDEFPKEGIDKLVGILEERWPKPAFAGDDSEQRGLTRAPSLRLLTTKSLARAFLCATKSTAEVQAIFEQKYFVESEISPLLATIAIITRATFARTDASNLDVSLKYFLIKLGLLSVEEKDVSGSLTQFESIGKTLDEMDYLDLVCFMYESAKFLMEEGCRSTFCFTLALFSSVQIGVRTGCISFALDVIGSLKEIEEDRFHIEYYSISPLSSLSACFSALFTSVGYNTCQEVQDALLEAFFKEKVRGSNSSSHDRIFNEDVRQSRVWMGMAYSHRRGIESAMDAIVSSIIISNQLNDADEVGSLRSYIDEEILETLRSLQVVHFTRDGYHTMKSYIQSAKRQQLTEKERDEMIKGFISKVLVRSPFLASDTIAELIEHYKAIDPLFLVGHANDIETNLINVSEFKTGLSQRASLFITSTIMHYVHDNSYVVLELGLRWLRNALCSQDGVVQFDNYDDYGRGQWAVNKFRDEGDYEVFFSSNAWSPSYHYGHETRTLEGQPKSAAKALVAVLEAKALLLLEQTPRISHLCQEALALCRVLDFLLEPTLEAIAAVDETWRNTQLQQDQLPPFLQPINLVALIMDLEWSVRPDYTAEREDGEGADGVPSISFIDERAAIAVHYGKFTDAVSLCTRAWNKEFWAKLSDRTSRWSIDWKCGKKIRRVLRACLHIIKGAISSGEDLPDDFMNQALHMILSMNWFRACTKCSPDVSKYAQQLVVCHDSIALVHQIALSWSDLSNNTKSPFGQSLGHCSNVIQCLSRCLHTLREEGMFRDWRCDECQYRFDIHRTCAEFDEGEEAVGQAKARKRRKLLGKSSAASDFKELERYATQLHMKEQCHWCKDATRRIENKS